MAFTMPEPIVFIDTEGKAHDIAHKFSDKVVYILQPENYEEVVGHMRTNDGTITSLKRSNTARGQYYPGALEKGLAILDKYKEERDIIGTLVVDSMSIMWEWAQQFYVDQWFDDAETAAEANFKSAMADKEGSGDWKQIKNYHNAKFREKMLAEPYHLYWTAMSTEDYNQMMDEELSYTPMKPYGESKNVFKVDQIIRARFNDEGIPVGDLEKPGLTKLQYRGLPYPTFEKHRKIMQFMINAEREGEEYDVVSIGEDEAEITREVTSRG